MPGGKTDQGKVVVGLGGPYLRRELVTRDINEEATWMKWLCEYPKNGFSCVSQADFLTDLGYSFYYK